MKKLTLQESLNLFLLTLHDLADGQAYEDVDSNDLALSLKMNQEQVTPIVVLLKKRELAGFSFGTAFLAAEGLVEAEKIMANDYADNELLVLKTIFEMSKDNPNREVHYDAVLKAVGLPSRRFIDITEELHNRKRYLGRASDEHLKLTAAGEEFLQKKNNMPKIGGDTFNTHNYAPSINQIGGQGNTQNAQININPEFDNAIKSIVDLVKSSNLPNFKKEDLITNIEHVKGLPTDAPSKELGEHGKSKINYLELAVKGTDIALKLSPHFQTLYTYFENLIRAST